MAFPFLSLTSDKPVTWLFGLSAVSVADPENFWAVKVLARAERNNLVRCGVVFAPCKSWCYTLGALRSFWINLTYQAEEFSWLLTYRLGFFCPDNKKAPMWGLEHE